FNELHVLAQSRQISRRPSQTTHLILRTGNACDIAAFKMGWGARAESLLQQIRRATTQRMLTTVRRILYDAKDDVDRSAVPCQDKLQASGTGQRSAIA